MLIQRRSRSRRWAGCQWRWPNVRTTNHYKLGHSLLWQQGTMCFSTHKLVIYYCILRLMNLNKPLNLSIKILISHCLCFMNDASHCVACVSKPSELQFFLDPIKWVKNSWCAVKQEHEGQEAHRDIGLDSFDGKQTFSNISSYGIKCCNLCRWIHESVNHSFLPLWKRSVLISPPSWEHISKMVLVDHFNINNIAEIKVNLSVVNKSKVSYYTY